MFLIFKKIIDGALLFNLVKGRSKLSESIRPTSCVCVLLKIAGLDSDTGNFESKMTARAILTSKVNSHPFDDRVVLLDVPVKIGRAHKDEQVRSLPGIDIRQGRIYNGNQTSQSKQSRSMKVSMADASSDIPDYSCVPNKRAAQLI